MTIAIIWRMGITTYKQGPPELQDVMRALVLGWVLRAFTQM